MTLKRQLKQYTTNSDISESDSDINIKHIGKSNCSYNVGRNIVLSVVLSTKTYNRCVLYYRNNKIKFGADIFNN